METYDLYGGNEAAELFYDNENLKEKGNTKANRPIVFGENNVQTWIEKFVNIVTDIPISIMTSDRLKQLVEIEKQE